jgi:hypothetical protein
MVAASSRDDRGRPTLIMGGWWPSSSRHRPPCSAAVELGHRPLDESRYIQLRATTARGWRRRGRPTPVRSSVRPGGLVGRWLFSQQLQVASGLKSSMRHSGPPQGRSWWPAAPAPAGVQVGQPGGRSAACVRSRWTADSCRIGSQSPQRPGRCLLGCTVLRDTGGLRLPCLAENAYGWSPPPPAP